MASPEEQLSMIVHAAMNAAGEKVVNEIRQKISRAHPPASEPATPPHLRTGDLALGIHHTVDELHDGVTLTIISDQPYSMFLRDGTDKMAARDFFKDADEQLLEACIREQFPVSPQGSASAAASAPLDQSPSNLSAIFGVDVI